MCLETKKGQSGICVILKSQWCHSVVVNHADIGSNTCHTRNSIVEEATVNYPIESTFIEKTHSPVSGLCYARNQLCNAGDISLNHVKNIRPINLPKLI